MTACCLIPLWGYLLISLLNRAPISLSALDLPDIIVRLLTCEWAGNILEAIWKRNKTKNQLSLFERFTQIIHFIRYHQTGLNVDDRWMQTSCGIFPFSSQRQRAWVPERSFSIIKGSCQRSEQMDGCCLKDTNYAVYINECSFESVTARIRSVYENQLNF